MKVCSVFPAAPIRIGGSLLLLWWSAHHQRQSAFHGFFANGLAVPKSEFVNRRKSPALWREDLQNKELDQDPIYDRGLLTKPPEVMSPCGGWPQLHAAIGNGADAIYLGLSAFSARARASNFDPVTELPLAVQTCHEVGVKVYVALNTLVFDHELEEVEELIRHCAVAQVDALIVQDLGVAQMARTVAPSLEVHASTQQTVTSADGAAFCDELLGSSRVVLGRELSLTEIDHVTTHLDPSVEIEAFVHGALCVSYSGQCFSSEAWGGRSANRGQCAQACRLPYGLIDNGELKELGDFSYLLSPQDLCGIDQVPRLLASHVSCLKIEGRLKDAAYVAATTRAYRNAVDEAWDEYCDTHGIPKTKVRTLPSTEQVTRKELAQVFSRGQDEGHNGLSPGFFEGSQHQTLVRGRSPRHRGVHVGRVVPEGSYWKQGLEILTDNLEELKLGDGIVVDRGMAQEEELGGAIFEIRELAKGRVAIHFSRDAERKWKRYDEQARKSGGTPLAPPGAHVWKTSDAAVDKKLKRLSEAPAPKSVGVAVSVSGKMGEPLHVRIDNGLGSIGLGMTQGNLETAERSGLSPKSVQKAIGTLGNTAWNMQGDIDLSQLEDGAWCPVSWIKEARRHAVEDLESQLSEGEHSKGDEEVKLELDVASKMLSELKENTVSDKTEETTKLSVLARNQDQVEALCQMVENQDGPSVDEIIVDFLEVDGMREAVARIRQAKVTVVVATPRIIKPEESGIWRTLLRLEPDALLVRSNGLLYRMMKLGGTGAKVSLDPEDLDHQVTIPELIGDFSLNVANALTAWELLEYGCSRVTASYDLSATAITELLDTAGPVNAARVEVVAHTHLPIFHTEHCVFARFLSNGDSYVDCGHVCTRHNIHLRDHTGADNLVLADMGCRNTVFSAQAQSGAYSLMQWMDVGARHFRVELVDEPAEDVKRIVRGYRDVLEGDRRPKELWSLLEDVRDSNGRAGGVGHGSFRNGVERRAGELK
jgi:putative protease